MSTHETASYYTSFAGMSHNATQIFSYLDAKELGICLSVCKQWNQYANNEALWNDLVPEMAFGPRQWKMYFGDIGEAPPFPRVIHQILNSPCPIWPEKRVHETHLLTLIPQTAKGQPLTLQSLSELVKKPLQGPATKYRHFYVGEYTDPPAPASHWTLLSRDVIPDSRSENYDQQEERVKSYHGYEVPNVLDTIVAIFMEHVRSGTRLYSDSPWTFTRCKEKYDTDWQLAVGGLGALGLYAHCDDAVEHEYLGVGASREFSDRA